MRPNNRAREHARAGPTTLVAVAAASLAALAVALLVPTGGAAQSQVAPRNTGEPSISGNPVVGETVQATRGTWTGTEPISFAFQWVRCPRSGGRADGSDCAVISGATTTAYVIGNADVDRRLRVRVTGSNSEGSATAASNATALVTRPASGQPRNTQRPAIAGTLRANETLRANPGTWTGTQPISFSFQWLRCDPGGGNCLILAGFNDDGYTLRDGDIGRSLRVQVTARNSEGSSSRLSARTGVVQAAAGPVGAIKLPNGETSIPVTSVGSSDRLVIDRVEFSPNPVRTRNTTLVVRIKVKETRGNVVRDALVFLRSTPLVTTTQAAGKTGQDGWIEYRVTPETDFPIRDGYNVQFFIRAYRQGDPPLAGIAGYRLVQVATARSV
jgi:hypothetical protein